MPDLKPPTIWDLLRSWLSLQFVYWAFWLMPWRYANSKVGFRDLLDIMAEEFRSQSDEIRSDHAGDNS